VREYNHSRFVRQVYISSSPPHLTQSENDETQRYSDCV